MRRAVIVIAGGITAAVLQATPASADTTIVVRGLGFPSGGLTNLAITGCPGLFDRVAEPVTSYLSRGESPAGTRSLKYDLAGGNAVGSQQAVASMTGTSVAGLSVMAPGGTSGVAYAGYQPPADWGTNRMWVGRADLSAAPGGWQSVDATGLTYTWTRYDLGTEERLPETADGPATVRAFAAGHGGDGPGFYTVGFGCDGQPFKIDALRNGSPGAVTTYDLEGFTSSTAISGSASTVRAGEPVTIAGSLQDELGRPVPQGLLVLEAREHDAAAFSPVDGAAASLDGAPSVTVTPDARTLYRWRFVGTWSVDGSISPTFTVDVGTVVTAEPEPGDDHAAPVAVVGATQPAKPGVRVTLWKVGPAGGRHPVATAVVGKDGGYRFEVERTRRDASYVVTVPATGGNLAGESAPRRIVGR
jgi:hypothetical protein